MKKIAVIGLGIMGHGIADNFLQNGYEVAVWNRTSQKADDLVAKGATLANSVKEVVATADLVFEVTANDESSRAIWLGPEGVLENARTDQALITCATLSIDWTDELAGLASQRDLAFFDMPMTGGRVAAESGQLTFLAGGDKDKLEELDAELQAIAKTVKHFGPTGSGMRYKLILNTLQAIHIASFGEAMRMAEAAGLDKQLVGNALVERPGGVITDISWQAYQQEPSQTGFSVEWIAKDLGYASTMAHDLKHPLLDDALAAYKAAIEAGYAQADWTKINKL